MENTRNSKFLAYFVSLLVMLAGAVCWAILYYFGVFSAWIAVASSYLALVTFQKYYNATSITFVWIVVMTIIINIASIFLMLLYSLKKLGLTFAEFINEPVCKKALASDIALCVLFSVIGLVVCIVVYKSNQNRKNKISTQLENKSVPSFVGTTTSNNTSHMSEDEILKNVVVKYEAIINGLKNATETFMQNNDKEVYREQIGGIYEQQILSMNQSLKDALLEKATNDLKAVNDNILLKNTYRLAIKLLGENAQL